MTMHAEEDGACSVRHDLFCNEAVPVGIVNPDYWRASKACLYSSRRMDIGSKGSLLAAVTIGLVLVSTGKAWAQG